MLGALERGAEASKEASRGRLATDKGGWEEGYGLRATGCEQGRAATT